ncbi:hypothetical protein DV737_g5674, partial [Chaetothyriales sp. CBS 132003]
MDFPSTMTAEQGSAKRPRSPTVDNPLPAAKVPRTSGQLQINYLARQHKETIPLVTVKLQLPEILRLIGEYDGVLQRHESMAGNLGACPLGPILLKRFERLFDGPPRILKSHARDANVTWLDVVEFARNKPEQFNLEKMRNGIRVCQFYTKQCRIEISEEDFVLIASGMPEKLIPPQPIPEDEQKELGVLDLLDRNLGQVIQHADQVSARARQLTHKMKNRLNSIEQPQSPLVGFTPVNARQSLAHGAEELFRGSSPGNVTYINGRSIKGASATERAEMMKQFMSVSERDGAAAGADHARRQSLSAVRQGLPPAALDTRPRADSLEMMASSALKQNLSTVAIPNTPASLMPQIKAAVPDRDDGGPFKTEMVQRMESMQRGERVIPPCDRCRRLHMDCLKNLTACMGCTKKHAKCSWKDVRQEELGESEQKEPDQQAVEGQWDSGHLSPGSPPTSVAAVVRAAEESRPPEAAAALTTVVSEGLTLANSLAPVTPPDGHSPAVHNNASSLAKAEAAATETNGPVTPRFDVRPPPLSQGPLHENRRSPPQPPPSAFSASYAVKEPPRPMEDENDEGDRLEALARSTYRSYSQSARSPEY